MIIKKHFHFNSCDGIHRVHGIMWKPDDREIIGFVQIVHGMIEHIDRYDDFARYLCEHGFAVAGEDHLGHGLTVNGKHEQGMFAKKRGAEYVISDNYRLKKHMEREFADVPYFILGHSMGSFITRILTANHSNELDGAIFMGTGNQPMLLTSFGKGMAAVMAMFKGWDYRSSLINEIAFGSYNKKFSPARTPHDWLTKDEKIVDLYESSDHCNFTFTLAGYRDLFTFISQACKGELIRKIQPEFPILIVSGDMDPVGDYGKGVRFVYEKYKDEGLEDVTLKLYQDDRHEILNETDREDVYEDILEWILAKSERSALT